MYEVEVKVPAGLDRVRDRLEAEGADRLGRVAQVDTYYDHPGRSFAETDEALRVRREDDRAALTYKGPRVDETTKTRREVESGVDDPDAVAAALETLGFAPAAEVRKMRERYALDGFVVTLDAIEGLGEFVEVETSGTALELEALREGAATLLERLGLDPADGVRASYLELLGDAQ